jgi:hypothetical protein
LVSAPSLEADFVLEAVRWEFLGPLVGVTRGPEARPPAIVDLLSVELEAREVAGVDDDVVPVAVSALDCAVGWHPIARANPIRAAEIRTYFIVRSWNSTEQSAAP